MIRRSTVKHLKHQAPDRDGEPPRLDLLRLPVNRERGLSVSNEYQVFSLNPGAPLRQYLCDGHPASLPPHFAEEPSWLDRGYKMLKRTAPMWPSLPDLRPKFQR